MSFSNLTPIRLGMTGNFAGRTYRVAGRIVMGMEEGGETYHWNEFHLIATDGTSATLVHEITERGAQWRMFTLFEPQTPLTVPEAASKRVGDTVHLDGKPMRVTLVDESRVHFIEGQAPEGVELGDVAHYFNAEAQNAMIVVSWTGDEIEFYRGLDLPRSAVPAAFGLRDFSGISGAVERPNSPAEISRWLPKAVPVVLMIMAFLAFGPTCRSSRSSSSVTKPKTPPAPLAAGARGMLNGRACELRSHSVVEMAHVGQRYDRHEYSFVADNDNIGLLVFGSRSSTKDCFIFTPFHPATPLTPQAAAARRLGDAIDFDGETATVVDLFRATGLQAENQEAAEMKGRTVAYGLSAKSGTNLFLIRWTDTWISHYRGHAAPAKAVTQAFSGKDRK